jgi:4-amino-4-deoxy-L-arabinose transferase-like glycosyltransferase
VGFAFTYVGLSIFLSGTTAAMTPLGFYVGKQLGNQPEWLIIVIAFIIGLVTILCEPAVHVLTGQIEEISDGRISKLTVLLTLSLGVGLAIALAAIRTVFNFSILYYVVPGYLISIILMFICPNIFTAMAFDSGGTASGPMSSSFVLPMVVGITVSISAVNSVTPNYYEQSFGVVAMIALTPIIAIQILGLVTNIKSVQARRRMAKNVYSADDAQIIHFN